ncbi:nucleotide-binding protein [Gemmobacter sp. 24YEA27]|uniref:nucleotide-binding protein n=1 Tax=Gemmobacter sp. 24YEA27 TaxID=3040672 RepID=UPI0024B32D31|nr:nucleotide-binding protein [Gemmobacter sp. 24YEA27]
MSLFSRIALAVCLALATPAAVSAQDVRPAEAAAYIGQSVTVTGTVSQVHYDKKSGNTFINMGGRYPNHTFYGIIFAKSSGAFSGVGSLQGATVSITGTVKDYRGKPQIVVTSPSQIVVR